MEQKRSLQYTVRDVSETTDNRLREAAALEGVSLNQATLQAIERGLGLTGQPVRYRTLGSVLASAGKVDRAAWQKTLSAMDKISPEDWK